MDTIAGEIDYYKANRQNFIEQYSGKFLVIKGKEVVGVYQSNTAAREHTMQYEQGTFIIEHPVLLKVR